MKTTTRFTIVLTLCLTLAMSYVAHAATYYVSPSGSHTTPYDTWAKASTDIQASVDASSSGDTVLVTNGTYAGSGSLVVSIIKNITLKSVNGPSVTIIKPTVNYRRGMQINSSATTAIISGFRFDDANMPNHQAAYYGAAIKMYAGTVTNCVFNDNYTKGRGGAVWMDGGLVTDCTFTSNRVTEWQYGYGGALYMQDGTVARCKFSDNYTLSRQGGGAIFMTGGTIENCIVTGNEAARHYEYAASTDGIGGGIRMSGGKILHCTIADNFSVGKGGGLYMTGGVVSNTIMYGNTVQAKTSDDYANIYKSGGTVGYSCVTPIVAGTGNVSLSPDFGDSANEDYTLGAASSCLDAGANIGITTDYGSSSRPADGDGDGSADYDIGALEAGACSSRDFACSFLATNTIALSSLTAEFTASVVGSDTNVTYFWWDFNKDGSPAMTTNGAGLWTVENSFSSVGYYDISLVVSNSSGATTTNTKSTYIKVMPSTLYVATNGSDTAPFDTPAKAAADVLSAVTAAYTPSGSDVEINIGAGTYSVTEEIAVIRPLRVKGAGVSSTILDPSGQARGFYIGHADAVVQDLTVSGASRPLGSLVGSGAGGGAWMSDGLITNCLFANNYIYDAGGGIYMLGGTVVDCVFTNNKAQEWQYGHGSGIYMAGGLVDRSYFHHNSSLSRYGGAGVTITGGTLRNSVIATNEATRSNAGSEGKAGGVRITGGLVENCTIVDNYAYGYGGGICVEGGAVSNSIIYHNSNSSGFSDDYRNVYKTAGTVDYSCVTPSVSGTGNTTNDPALKNLAGGDYRLTQGSPCVDTGSNHDWMTGAKDFGGSTRVSRGTVDIGAYEDPIRKGPGIFVD